MARGERTPGDTTTNIARRRASAKADGGPAYQARRDEIIAAAGRLFLEKGYRATSFRDIAEDIGLDRATLYYYFAGKQELFQTATGAAVERNTEAAERVAASDAPPDEKVAQLFSLLLESYTKTDYPYMFIFLQEDVNRITRDSTDRWARTFRALARRYEDAVRTIFEQGVASGVIDGDLPPAVLTKALIGMANWTQRWYRPDGPLSAQDIADVFTRVMLRGVAPEPAGLTPPDDRPDLRGR